MPVLPWPWLSAILAPLGGGGGRPGRGVGWSQADEMADDLSVGEAGFEADTAVEDGLASGGVGVCSAGFGSSTEDQVAGWG